MMSKNFLVENKSSYSFYSKANNGEYPVGIVDNIILKDKRRDREIPLIIYYPKEQGTFPVIIFSHGTGRSKESFSYLSNFWASHGYVCIHPTHLGSDSSLLKKVGFQALIQMGNDPKSWPERPQDISFIIDSFEELEQQVPPLKGKIDRSSIGISGHSYGAYTTMLIAGTVIDIPDRPEVSFRDDRAQVFLAISPQGTNRLGLNKYSWDKINTPMMTVSGSKDEGWKGKPASWRIEAFNLMPPGDKYHILIEGANHFSFDSDEKLTKAVAEIMNSSQDKSMTASENELESEKSIKIYLKSASIAFWDAYLKSKDTGKQYIKSDEIQIYSNGDVSIFLK